jgi:hypothetical protein
MKACNLLPTREGRVFTGEEKGFQGVRPLSVSTPLRWKSCLNRLRAQHQHHLLRRNLASLPSLICIVIMCSLSCNHGSQL